jgi:hypothetical protein
MQGIKLACMLQPRQALRSPALRLTNSSLCTVWLAAMQKSSHAAHAVRRVFARSQRECPCRPAPPPGGPRAPPRTDSCPGPPASPPVRRTSFQAHHAADMFASPEQRSCQYARISRTAHARGSNHGDQIFNMPSGGSQSAAQHVGDRDVEVEVQLWLCGCIRS